MERVDNDYKANVIAGFASHGMGACDEEGLHGRGPTLKESIR